MLAYMNPGVAALAIAMHKSRRKARSVVVGAAA
jgi:hypothetical protein